MPKSFYDAVGGAKTFDAIVSRFYAQVAEDEVLRRVYPEDDLAGAEERLRMFLEQYWGPTNLLGAARPPPIADAACPVSDLAHRTRRLAAVHAYGCGLHRLRNAR